MVGKLVNIPIFGFHLSISRIMPSSLLPSCLRILLVGLLFLSSHLLIAQKDCTFSGKVTDSQTGKPMKGATITLGLTNTGILTDSLGKFMVRTACGENTVRVSFIGYIAYNNRLTLKGNEELNVELQDITAQLQEVVISSQAAVRNTETPSLGVNVLSLRAIQKLPPAAGEVDILRSLQMLPGVSSVGEGSNGINVRGGAVDQNLIYLDNMPIFNPTHLLGLFSLFPTDAIREMDIYKGSIPARYGGRTSSVLDVKMTEPSTESFSFKGGIGMISNRANLEIPLIHDKLSILLSGRFSDNEYMVNLYNSLFIDTRVDPPIPNNHASFYDFAGKILYKPTEKDNITFSSYLGSDKYEVDSLFAIAGSLAKKSNIQYGHQNFSLRWNHFFKPGLNFNLIGVSSQYATKTGVPDGTAALDLTTQINYKNVKAELTYIPSKKLRFNTGLSVIRYDIQPANLIPAPGSIITQVLLQHQQSYESAAFASVEYELSDKLLIDGGFRYVQYMNIGPYNQPIYSDNSPKALYSINDTLRLGSGAIESSYGKLEPRLAIRYKLDDQYSLKAGYNRMNQFIQILTNNTTPLPNARWQTANRYIPPQESDLYSLGFFHDSKQSFWEYSVEVYYRDQRHLFDYVSGADLQINTAIETQLISGKGRSYGLEFLLSKKKGVMTGWMSYTYARSLEQVTGDFPAVQQLNGGAWFPSSVDKPHSLNLALNFQAEKHNILSFTFQYNTGRPYTAPVSFYTVGKEFIPVYLDRNNDRISDYHRLDFSWTLKPNLHPKHWESSWVFAVYNLYGRQNAYSYFFKPNGYGFRAYYLSVFSGPIASLTYNVAFK